MDKMESFRRAGLPPPLVEYGYPDRRVDYFSLPYQYESSLSKSTTGG